MKKTLITLITFVSVFILAGAVSFGGECKENKCEHKTCEHGKGCVKHHGCEEPEWPRVPGGDPNKGPGGPGGGGR